MYRRGRRIMVSRKKKKYIYICVLCSYDKETTSCPFIKHQLPHTPYSALMSTLAGCEFGVLSHGCQSPTSLSNPGERDTCVDHLLRRCAKLRSIIPSANVSCVLFIRSIFHCFLFSFFHLRVINTGAKTHSWDR